jgi:hypothetical protein
VGKTMTAIFDGTVLRPESPADLEPDTRYLVTVEALQAKDEGDAWDLLESLTGAIEAPDDWAQEHDHYLYETPRHPKRAAG